MTHQSNSKFDTIEALLLQLAKATEQLRLCVVDQANAEAENAALLALLEEIKGRVQFGTSTHMSSDIVKMCDAALKEGK